MQVKFVGQGHSSKANAKNVLMVISMGWLLEIIKSHFFDRLGQRTYGTVKI